MEIKKKIVNFNFEGVSLKLTFDQSEDAISTEIMRTSCWEPWQLQLYRILLNGENPTFIDIGANVGVNSIFAKARCPKTRVVAIEPATINLSLLRENIENSSQKIEVVPVAVSEINGEIQLIGDHTHAHVNLYDSEGVKVKSARLDDLIANLKVNSIDLLKIDVEGYTDKVLSFSDETLLLTRNAIVEFSLSDLEMRFNRNQVEIKANISEVYEKITQSLPFVFYISRTEGLVSVTFDEFVEVLLVEQTVGDFLFSRIKHEAISVQVYALRKIRVLQHENHLRILENQHRNEKSKKKLFR